MPFLSKQTWLCVWLHFCVTFCKGIQLRGTVEVSPITGRPKDRPHVPYTKINDNASTESAVATVNGPQMATDGVQRVLEIFPGEESITASERLNLTLHEAIQETSTSSYMHVLEKERSQSTDRTATLHENEATRQNEARKQNQATFRTTEVANKGYMNNSNRNMSTEEIPGHKDPLAIIHTGSMSAKQYKYLSLSISLVGNTVVALTGVTGNVIIFVIFIRNKTEMILQNYLIALCVSDSLSLLANIWYTISKIAGLFDELLGSNLHAFTFPLVVYMYPTAVRLSLMYITLVSVERFVAVLWPFDVQDFAFRRHPKRIIIVMSLIIALSHIPQLFKYTPTWVVEPKSNRSRLINPPSDFFKSSGKFYSLFMTISTIVFLQVPILVILFSSVGIAFELRKAKKRREGIQASSKTSLKEKEATRVVLILAISGAVCVIPGTSVYIVNILNPNFGFYRQEHFLYISILEINSLLTMVNSSINAIIYLTCNSQFREKAKALCCTHWMRGNNPTFTDAAKSGRTESSKYVKRTNLEGTKEKN